jgi:hypothetical protein
MQPGPGSTARTCQRLLRDLACRRRRQHALAVALPLPLPGVPPAAALHVDERARAPHLALQALHEVQAV